MKRYAFLVAHQRSGSHFLGYCIGSHPKVAYVDEITRIKSIDLLRRQLKTKEDVVELLEDKFGNIEKPIILVDVKYRHMMPALEGMMRESRVIHLYREDKLDTYYSMLHAFYRKKGKLGEYVEGGEVTDVKAKPREFPLFSRNEEAIQLLVEGELRFRRKYGHLAGLTFSYEELTGNRNTSRLPDWAMRKICEFLEIEEHPMKAKTIKMSPSGVRKYLH